MLEGGKSGSVNALGLRGASHWVARGTRCRVLLAYVPIYDKDLLTVVHVVIERSSE